MELTKVLIDNNALAAIHLLPERDRDAVTDVLATGKFVLHIQPELLDELIAMYGSASRDLLAPRARWLLCRKQRQRGE